MKSFLKKTVILALVCVLASQSFFVLNVSAVAADRYVSTLSELTDAIARSSAGDNIIITSNILATAEIAINKSITIDGTGHSISVPTPGLSDAGTYNTNPSAFRVFDISGSGNTVSISNCTIKGGKVITGYDNGGGAIKNTSSILKLNNVTISNSQAGISTTSSFGAGGGLCNSGGTVFLKDCNVSRNAASFGGGFLNVNSGKMFVENSTFSENRSLYAYSGGGAGENKAYLYINNSTFSNNKSNELGGAINNNGGQAYIINSTFVGNVSYSPYKGGAIANNNGNVTAVNSLFAYNYRLNNSNYELSDVEAYSASTKINAYYSIFQNLDATDINATVCSTYTGNATGSDNTLVTGGILTKVLNADGTEVGSSMVFQPLLCKRNSNSKTLTALLKNGSLSYGNGTRAGFTNGNGTPTIGYYDGSSWVTLLGSDPSSYETTLDQNYDGQLTPRSVGAVIAHASDLYMLKVNAVSGGSVLGGSIYGDVYPAGTTVSLTVVADTGKRFVRWDYVLGGTGTASTSNPYTVTVDKNITLVPVFENATGFTVSYFGNGNTGGSTPSAQEFPLDGSVTIADTPALVKANSIFAGWNTRADGLGTDYTAGALYNTNQNLVLYAKWEALTTYNVTYIANGSTGGTVPTDSSYSEGAAVTVAANTGKLSKTGCGFAGWNTAPDGSGISYKAGSGSFTMGTTDVTLYAQFIKTEISLKATDDDFFVNIKGWDPDCKYQIWSYQRIISDIFLNKQNNFKADQWILSQAYTLGSSEEGIVQADGSLDFIIKPFTSPDKNYTVAVRISDENNNFINEVRDSFTPAEAQEVVITKVLVDGTYAKGNEIREIKEIKADSSVLFKVIDNNVANTTYTATVVEEGIELTVQNTNEFVWSTSALTPGVYTVKIVASNGNSTDTRSIKIQLYSVDNSIHYGNISSMDVIAGSGNEYPTALNIIPSFTNGSFYYQIRESGREPIIRSARFTQTGSTIEETITKPGVYEVYGFVNREGVSLTDDSGDDGIIKTFEIKRNSNTPSTMTVTANVDINKPVAKNTDILFTATSKIGGIEQTTVQYSFWRYDAKGYTLVKDWNTENTLDWTPARVGVYTIEIRAKGADAGSYEVKKSIIVNVTDPAEQIAQNVSISINQAELIANAKSRTPIVIKASATSSNSQDLLYKFIVSDVSMGSKCIQNYSVNQYCIWTPRKAGIFKISVLVKNEASFGKYDGIQTYTITVK